jgi:hypothetical protein
VERGLEEPPLAQPDPGLGEQKPVAEQPREQTDAGTLDEVPVPRDQDLFDGIRVVEEQPAPGPEAYRHDVAVLAGARGIEAELIAREVRTTSEKEVASRPSGKRLDRDGLRLFFRSGPERELLEGVALLAGMLPAHREGPGHLR